MNTLYDKLKFIQDMTFKTEATSALYSKDIEHLDTIIKLRDERARLSQIYLNKYDEIKVLKNHTNALHELMDLIDKKMWAIQNGWK